LPLKERHRLPYSINAAITNNQRDSYIKNKAVVPTSGVIDSLGVSSAALSYQKRTPIPPPSTELTHSTMCLLSWNPAVSKFWLMGGA